MSTVMHVTLIILIPVIAVLGYSLAAKGVSFWADRMAEHNEALDAKDAAYVALKKRATDSGNYWINKTSNLTNEKMRFKEEVGKLEGYIGGWQVLYDQVDWNYGRVLFENSVLKTEIAEWEERVVGQNTEPNEPEPLAFTDLVQTSIKGVVHLKAPQWQGSGFVVGPQMIGTARHCVDGVEDFLITTHDGHQIRATRAISDKQHDVALIWVDDLTCVAKERGTLAHEITLSPLHLGSIKDCVLGQSVYVIGSPYGKMNFNSLTTGIISGVDVDWSPLGDDYGWEAAFTVDSAGHPGNSGCPVFTTDGIVRGIIVGRLSPVLISVMPCDLFLADLDSIRLMFKIGRYQHEEAQHEEAQEYTGEYWNYVDNNEYYTID